MPSLLPPRASAILAWAAVVIVLLLGLALLPGRGVEQPMLHAAAPQAAAGPAHETRAVRPALEPDRVDDALPEELPPTF